MRLAYEELATNPQETTQKVCDFLGIEFRADMINYWSYEHHMLSGNQGTKSLIDKYKIKSQNNEPNKKDLSIKLDSTWKTDLTQTHLQKFYETVGEQNKLYEWNY